MWGVQCLKIRIANETEGNSSAWDPMMESLPVNHPPTCPAQKSSFRKTLQRQWWSIQHQNLNIATCFLQESLLFQRSKKKHHRHHQEQKTPHKTLNTFHPTKTPPSRFFGLGSKHPILGDYIRFTGNYLDFKWISMTGKVHWNPDEPIGPTIFLRQWLGTLGSLPRKAERRNLKPPLTRRSVPDVDDGRDSHTVGFQGFSVLHAPNRM